MNSKLQLSHIVLAGAFIIGSYLISNAIAPISQRDYVRMDQVSDAISNLAYEIGQLYPQHSNEQEPYLEIAPGVLTYGQLFSVQLIK